MLELLARIKRQDAGIEEMPPVSLPRLDGGGTDGEGGATVGGRQDDSSEDGFLDLNATDEGFLDEDLEDDFDKEDFEYEVEDDDDDEDRTDQVVDAYLSGGTLECAPKEHDCRHETSVLSHSHVVQASQRAALTPLMSHRLPGQEQAAPLEGQAAGRSGNIGARQDDRFIY